MFLTDLADACRKSGLTVVEIDDWQTRARPASTGTFNPRGILCHHTAGKPDSHDYAYWMAVEGREDLPAPLCQLALSRMGVVYVIAAGRANHAGESKAHGTIPAGDGNALYLGIEAMNTGTEGWTATQYDAYVRLVAALCKHYGWLVQDVAGHKETSVTGKIDPTFDMGKFRRDVAALIAQPQRKPWGWAYWNMHVVNPTPLRGTRRVRRRAKRAIGGRMRALLVTEAHKAPRLIAMKRYRDKSDGEASRELAIYLPRSLRRTTPQYERAADGDFSDGSQRPKAHDRGLFSVTRGKHLWIVTHAGFTVEQTAKHVARLFDWIDQAPEVHIHVGGDGNAATPAIVRGLRERGFTVEVDGPDFAADRDGDPFKIGLAGTGADHARGLGFSKRRK